MQRNSGHRHLDRFFAAQGQESLVVGSNHDLLLLTDKSTPKLQAISPR